MKKIASKLKQIIPWAVAAGIFVYLFRIYPPSEVWRALKFVNLPVFIAFAVGYFVFIYIVDSWVTQRVITKFACPVKFRDIFAARGVTYLIMVLNYPASQAGFAYYLKRRYGIPIFQALGIFLFIVSIDLIWITNLAFAGSFFQDYAIGGIALNRTVQITAAIVYGVALIWLAFWRRWPEKLIGRHINVPFIEKLRKRKVFHIFDRAHVSDYLRVAIMRIPIHFTIIISMYVVLKTFGTNIPFTKILSNIPLVFFIGTLPITPGGLGTTNAATVELLSPYLSGPMISSGAIDPRGLLFTATLLWMFANYLMKVLTGTTMLRRVSSDLFKPTDDVSEEKAEHEAAHMGGNI
ncbi:MAG: lysylphosphatidylglycerol synthase transmembrane domain-containing protein [bacterium]